MLKTPTQLKYFVPTWIFLELLLLEVMMVWINNVATIEENEKENKDINLYRKLDFVVK